MVTAQGTADGTSWTNAKAYSSLAGSNFVRGDRYYFADGTYGNVSNGLNISTAASGTTIIELRKAQSYDYGRSSDGCSNDISGGWNASTMGSSQAAWYSPTCIPSNCTNSIVNLGTGGYITINGNGQYAAGEVGCGGVEANPPAAMTDPAPTPSNCGFLISDYTCLSTATDGCDTAGGEIRGGGAGIVWEGVEWFGQGNYGGTNAGEPAFDWANGGTLTNMIVTQGYIHNIGTVGLVVVSGGWNNGTYSYNYAWGEFDSSINHGEAIQLQGNISGFAVHHNIWRDHITNGDVVSTDTGGNTLSGSVYDNADICSSGYTCTHNDGSIGCFGTGICNGLLIYNNTWAYQDKCGYNIGGGSGNVSGVITLYNNLYYNCTSFITTNGSGGTNTIDYNTYLCSSKAAVGAHDVSVSSSCPNPFVNLHTGVQLASENSDWNNRDSLGAPYDTTDLYGNAFTTDRGAAQYEATVSGVGASNGMKLSFGAQVN